MNPPKVPRRQVARPEVGLTYVDANKRLVGISPDVLDIRARIRELYPGFPLGTPGGVDTFWDTEAEEWVIVQIDYDGTQSMVFTTKELDQRVLDRLARADNQRTKNPDLEDVLQKEEKELERQKEKRFDEQLEEAGEKLLFALKKDGFDAGITKVHMNRSRLHIPGYIERKLSKNPA